MAINNINGVSGQQPARSGEGSRTQPGRGENVTSHSSAGQAPGADSVSLTDTAARLRMLEGTLSASPEVDSARVADIQRAIADGSYQIDAGKIADKLLDFEAAFTR